VSRFLMEALRTNPPLALGLTQAQLISLPVVVVGLVGLAWMARTGLRTGGGGDHD
jgi:prolipoprotein diacylglyceryltransferase